MAADGALVPGVVDGRDPVHHHAPVPSPTTSTTIETVTTPDGDRFDTTVIRPETPNGAGILLLQEIFGVGEFLLGKAEDLAALGYVVSCPDVFWRIEPNVALPHDDEAMAVAFDLVGRYAELDRQVSTGDLVAALSQLRTHVMGKVAVMGYCLGGLLAYELAVASFPDACVSYYGSGIADQLHLADAISCPTLFHFGTEDPFIPNEQVDAIEAAFAGRSDVEIVRHGGASHAFENLFAPQFANPDAARISWAETVTFLGTTLDVAT